MNPDKRILVVDDEKDAQALFLQMFRREIRKGLVSIEFAESAEEAWKMISDSETAFSFVLSDINMGGKSGLELLEQIKASHPNIPVAMLSAYGDQDTVARALNLGATQFIPKPLSFSSIKELIL